MSFDPLAALEVLVEHDVEFVIIGGLAARLLGSPTVTNDLDVCVADDRANLDRTTRALDAMDARLRGVADEVPFILDGRTLAEGSTFTFDTDHGALDVLRQPDGTTGFVDIRAGAEEVTYDFGTVLYAALDTLMRMKRAAGRPKDRIELEVLAALREERDRGGSAQG